MTRRAAPKVSETSSYTAVLPSATPVAMEVAQEVAITAAEASDADRPMQD